MGDWGMKLKGTGMQLKDQIINVALYKRFSFPCSMAVPDTSGQGVILKLAIDSYKMPGYEIWESFTRGKNFPVSDCLETRSREGLMVAQFTAGNCWYPGNNTECTNHETSWSLLESHSFGRAVCGLNSDITAFASHRNALTTSPFLFFPVPLLILWLTQICRAMRRGRSQSPQTSCPRYSCTQAVRCRFWGVGAGVAGNPSCSQSCASPGCHRAQRGNTPGCRSLSKSCTPSGTAAF